MRIDPKEFRHGCRVKGAWGYGTAYGPVRAVVKAGAFSYENRYFVRVKWDKGIVSADQLLSALTLAKHGDDGLALVMCPECDDEMIFYIGDYICALCRERMEDALA